MAIKRYRPTSAARRFMTVSAYEEITSTKPERSLLHDKRKTGGRNNQDNRTPHRRRQQNKVQNYRLQAQQGRHTRNG